MKWKKKLDTWIRYRHFCFVVLLLVLRLEISMHWIRPLHRCDIASHERLSFSGPEDSILFSIRGDIRRMCVHCSNPLDVPMALDHEMDKDRSGSGSLRNASSAMALEFDHISGSIFWSDRINQAIWTAFWDGTNQKVWNVQKLEIFIKLLVSINNVAKL